MISCCRNHENYITAIVKERQSLGRLSHCSLQAKVTREPDALRMRMSRFTRSNVMLTASGCFDLA